MTLIKKMWLFFAGFWIFVILIFLCISVGIFGFMPSFEELENPRNNLATEIISCDGAVLGTYYIENRSNVDYAALSPYLIKALVATEDARFYNHSGIDMRALARVVGKTLLGQNSGAGGGSTITQQLAKNLFPRKRQNKLAVAFRKLKEWVIAVKLEHNYTKEEIIVMYLNTVDFGNNSFGIKTAANTYFGTTPDSLRIEEAALLIGMLKAPSYYSPIRHSERALLRREVVLSQMQKMGYISNEEYEQFRQRPLDLTKFKQQDHKAGLGTYFREYLRRYLTTWCENHRKPDGTAYNLYRDGLKIYTTIDSRMQRYAEEAVAEHLGKDLQPAFYSTMKGMRNAPFNNVTEESVQRFLVQAMKQSERYRNLKSEGATTSEIERAFKQPVEMQVFTWQGMKDTVMSPWDSLVYYKWFLHCGLMSIEPQTGHVKAYVGGINYDYFQFDNVTGARRQVGSTFKPFVYTMALAEGDFLPCDEVPNVKVCVEQAGLPDWCPKNSTDAKEGEMVTLKWALANSVNYISAYLIKRFSPQSVVNLVRGMGITSPIEAVPSICLGTCDLSVCEMTGAMATYANKGVFTKPMFITSIEDRNGVVLERFSPEQHEAMNERTAYVTTKLMQGVVDGGTGIRLRYKYGITAPIAGKTGTTQNNSDGWFMGLTPNLVTGVWVGGEVRSIHFRRTDLGQGAHMALPIWAIYMKKVFEDKNINLYQGDFEQPEGVLDQFDCTKTTEEDQLFIDEV